MGKKLLIIAIVLIAVAVGLFLGLNNISILPYTTSIQTQLQPLVTLVQQNILPFVGGAFTLLITVGTALYKKLRNVTQIKEEVTAQAESLVSSNYQISEIASDLQKQLAQKEEQVKALQAQINNIPQEVSNLKNQLTVKEQQLSEIIQRKNIEIQTLQNLLAQYKMKEKVIVK